MKNEEMANLHYWVSGNNNHVIHIIHFGIIDVYIFESKCSRVEKVKSVEDSL